MGDASHSRGEAVEVWNGFTGRWTGGFEVSEIVEESGRPVAVRVRRSMDGIVLPGALAVDAVRAHRRPSRGAR